MTDLFLRDWMYTSPLMSDRGTTLAKYRCKTCKIRGIEINTLVLLILVLLLFIQIFISAVTLPADTIMC